MINRQPPTAIRTSGPYGVWLQPSFKPHQWHTEGTCTPTEEGLVGRAGPVQQAWRTWCLCVGAHKPTAHCGECDSASSYPGICPGSGTYRDRPGHQPRFLRYTKQCQGPPIPKELPVSLKPDLTGNT